MLCVCVCLSVCWGEGGGKVEKKTEMLWKKNFLKIEKKTVSCCDTSGMRRRMLFDGKKVFGEI
jgi:hypothetical protein